jgi:hypothetical protein
VHWPRRCPYVWKFRKDHGRAIASRWRWIHSMSITEGALMRKRSILTLSATLVLACSGTQVDSPGVVRSSLEQPDGGESDAAPACAHSTCASGVALSPSCSPCAATVCAVDPYCCQTSWDETCVGEGKSLCTGSCETVVPDAGPSACSHPVCAVGIALVATCDSCAQAVCAADAFCCSGGWDATCVGEAVTICGVTCQ